MTPDEKNRLADYLNGTCNTMDQALEALGIQADSMEAEEAVADTVFLCAECGWWCECDEANESDDGDKCNDCSSG